MIKKHHHSMKTIDLTTKFGALNYLRSLGDDDVEIVDATRCRRVTSAAQDAVSTLSDQDAYEWASTRGRWIFTADELAEIFADRSVGASPMQDADTITIHHPEGCAPYTDSVAASEAPTHIAARDGLAAESALLQHYMSSRAAGHDYDSIPGWRMVAEDGDWMTYVVPAE